MAPMTEHRPLNTAHLPLKLRVEDYLALNREGAFDAYSKTELIDGGVLFMNAQHRAHARIKSRLHLLIASALLLSGSEFEALVEASVAIPPHDVPEPDIILTNEAGGDGLVPARSVALVVEVSDSTLDTDLGAKVALYAGAGIAEYWVVDVQRRVIEQMSSPTDGDYGKRTSVNFGERLSARTIDALDIDTTRL